MPADIEARMLAIEFHSGEAVGLPAKFRSGPDVEKSGTVTSAHGLPPDLLNQYIEIYHNAAKVHLDELGEPIVAWLAQFKNGNQAEK